MPTAAPSAAARFAYLDAPAPLAFAHRGANNAAENTMAAFEAAVRLGYQYVETDARATADGALLAFHDATLDRVTDRTGRVAELTYAEVARARVAGAEPIPLLADVLGAWPDLRVNIDVKEAPVARPLAELLRRAAAVDRVCVASFSDAWIGRLRAALGPRLCTAMGPREALRLRVQSLRCRAGSGGRLLAAGCVQVPRWAGPAPMTDRWFLRAAHRLGLPVHVWTVNDAAAMTRLLDAGVDGIMTDEAGVLREVLRGRGQWHG